MRRASRLVAASNPTLPGGLAVPRLDTKSLQISQIRAAAAMLPDQREMRMSESLAEPRGVVVARLETLARYTLVS